VGEIQQVCRKTVKKNFKYCSRALDDTLGEIMKKLYDNTVRGIKENLETTQKTIKEINDNLKLATSESNKKAQEIQIRIKNLEHIESQVNKTINEVKSGFRTMTYAEVRS
jgi:archaellum component FlaC